MLRRALGCAWACCTADGPCPMPANLPSTSPRPSCWPSRPAQASSNVAARTLAGGRSEGVASSFGTGLGGMVHVLAGSLGVSAIVLASAELFTALKLIGAAYLVWIGLRTLQSARQDAALDRKEGSAAPS